MRLTDRRNHIGELQTILNQGRGEDIHVAVQPGRETPRVQSVAVDARRRKTEAVNGAGNDRGRYCRQLWVCLHRGGSLDGEVEAEHLGVFQGLVTLKGSGVISTLREVGMLHLLVVVETTDLLRCMWRQVQVGVHLLSLTTAWSGVCQEVQIQGITIQLPPGGGHGPQQVRQEDRLGMRREQRLKMTGLLVDQVAALLISRREQGQLAEEVLSRLAGQSVQELRLAVRWHLDVQLGVWVGGRHPMPLIVALDLATDGVLVGSLLLHFCYV